MGNFIDSFDIPWTFVWGNHDNEYGNVFLQQVAQNYNQNCKNVLFYNHTDSKGNGNFVIKLQNNDRLVSALFFMDTHNLVTENKQEVYGRLNDYQKRWYNKKLNEFSGCQNATLFMHIPLKAYNDAFLDAYGSEFTDEGVSVQQSYSAIWQNGYENSFGVKRENVASNPFDDFIETIVQSNVSTTVVAGHDHVNNFVINYRGVKLAYALKTGIGCYNNNDLNGGTIVSIDKNGITDVYHEYVALD